MKLLDGFCQMQCTLREIANYFNCSEDTIENRVRQVHGVSFSEYFAKKRVTGLVALRRNLFRLSERNVAAAIFLAKNYLGMSDKGELDITSGGKRLFHEMSDEELTAIVAGGRSGGTTEPTQGAAEPA